MPQRQPDEEEGAAVIEFKQIGEAIAAVQLDRVATIVRMRHWVGQAVDAILHALGSLDD